MCWGHATQVSGHFLLQTFAESEAAAAAAVVAGDARQQQQNLLFSWRTTNKQETRLTQPDSASASDPTTAQFAPRI